MIAIYLAPVYIILNLYILRWAYLWMGSCHSILRTMAFRTIFASRIKNNRKLFSRYFSLLADDRNGG